MRTDKKKNISKVANVVLKEPLLTRDEIAIKAGVGQGTASRALEELDEIGRKDPKIIQITDKDLENIEKMQEVLSEKIKDPEQMKGTRLGELAQAMKEATARYSLFRGSATDKEGGMKLPDVTFQIINPNGEEDNQS